MFTRTCKRTRLTRAPVGITASQWHRVGSGGDALSQTTTGRNSTQLQDVLYDQYAVLVSGTYSIQDAERADVMMARVSWRQPHLSTAVGIHGTHRNPRQALAATYKLDAVLKPTNHAGFSANALTWKHRNFACVFNYVQKRLVPDFTASRGELKQRLMRGILQITS
jgi:hypothetical protein